MDVCVCLHSSVSFAHCDRRCLGWFQFETTLAKMANTQTVSLVRNWKPILRKIEPTDLDVWLSLRRPQNYQEKKLCFFLFNKSIIDRIWLNWWWIRSCVIHLPSLPRCHARCFGMRVNLTICKWILNITGFRFGFHDEVFRVFEKNLCWWLG